MPATNVPWPTPLTRFPTLFPPQFGVPGTGARAGLRQSTEGVVFFVDPNFPGAVDQRDGTEPTAPLRTVAAALARCQPYRGDTIAVMANNAWYYTSRGLGWANPVSEEVIVTVPGVRIAGIAPSSTTQVMWTPASDGGTCIVVRACDVLIEGFVFTEGLAYAGCNAIYAEYGGGAYGDSLTVRHCLFDDTVDVGIQLEYVWYADIHDNMFQCDDYGVYCDPDGIPPAYSQIHDNRFDNCGISAGGAIYVPGARHCEIAHNRIYNFAAQQGAAGPGATNQGICTGDPRVLPDPPVTGNYNLVHHNTLSCLLPAAAAGDYDDFNEANDTPLGTQTDAWIENYCMDGPSTTIPA